MDTMAAHRPDLASAFMCVRQAGAAMSQGVQTASTWVQEKMAKKGGDEEGGGGGGTAV
jgi:hypothetical protein